MINLLTPPTLYFLIGLIVVLSLIAYWKREIVKKELRRWRFKEVTAGPVKLERQAEEKQEIKSEHVAGIHFGEGTDFTGAKIKRVAGRDILAGSEPSRGNTSASDATPGIFFGSKGVFKDTDIEDVAGRDVELNTTTTPEPDALRSETGENKKTNDEK